MKSYRFITLCFQMFIILKLFDYWNSLTGLGFRSFIIIFIFGFVVFLEKFMAKYFLGRNSWSLLPFKGPKYTKTGEALDIFFFVFGAIIFAFAYGRELEKWLLFFLIGFFVAIYYIMYNLPLLNKFRYVALAVSFGFFIASSNSFLLFSGMLFGNLIIYLISEPGQF